MCVCVFSERRVRMKEAEEGGFLLFCNWKIVFFFFFFFFISQQRRPERWGFSDASAGVQPAGALMEWERVYIRSSLLLSTPFFFWGASIGEPNQYFSNLLLSIDGRRLRRRWYKRVERIREKGREREREKNNPLWTSASATRTTALLFD